MSDEDIEKVERYTQPRLDNAKRKIDNKKSEVLGEYPKMRGNKNLS